jgi:hypothetical protein
MAKSSGKYFADVMQGNVFHGVTAAAGTTFPLSTGTAMTFGLWNVTPNKNGVLLGLNAGFTSGTLALGEVGLTAIYGGYATGDRQQHHRLHQRCVGHHHLQCPDRLWPSAGHAVYPFGRHCGCQRRVLLDRPLGDYRLHRLDHQLEPRLRWQGDRAAGLGGVRHRLDCPDSTVLHVPDLG